jgi:hypothetical protein
MKNLKKRVDKFEDHSRDTFKKLEMSLITFTKAKFKQLEQKVDIDMKEIEDKHHCGGTSKSSQ